MKSGRDEAARGSIPGSSPRPDREHRKPQPTTCYTVVCVKTAVEISEESRNGQGNWCQGDWCQFDFLSGLNELTLIFRFSSGRESELVNGRAAASEEKRIDLSEEIAWFGDILK